MDALHIRILWLDNLLAKVYNYLLLSLVGSSVVNYAWLRLYFMWLTRIRQGLLH